MALTLFTLQGLASVGKQVASTSQSSFVRLPRARPRNAPLPDRARLRVRALDAVDETVPLLRGGGEPRLYDRRVASAGHRKADGDISQCRQCHSGTHAIKLFCAETKMFEPKVL